MEITYDPVKNQRNITDRGLSFGEIVQFDFETAFFEMDTRHDYGEMRVRALGLLNRRVYAVVFVETGRGIRVISFRRANPREVKYYEQTQS